MKLVRFCLPGQDAVHSGELRHDSVTSPQGTFKLNQVRLLTPCQPSKIVCVGVNYHDHAKEMGRDLPEHLMLFFKPLSALIGPEDEIRLPNSARVDYEGEIAVVIKQRTRNTKAKDAPSAILGYTCFNDVSDRVAQGWERNWVRAKGFDTSASLGPVIATPDERKEPFQIETRVNGEVRQKSDSSQLLFSIPQIIEEITSFMTLEAGDVIATGTPSGVGPLSPGDIVEVEIKGIGVLRNRVAR
jgi:2-keto-4-pentenoate hydratase/2-oxohepta-3-ene-1,7-dioic acid hydratase in catechol pathway